jgi:hypothetical protein
MTLFGHTDLTCQYFSVATSVKLVHILNNNLYLRDFPISCNTFWSMLFESKQMFDFHLLNGDLLLSLQHTHYTHTKSVKNRAMFQPFFLWNHFADFRVKIMFRITKRCSLYLNFICFLKKWCFNVENSIWARFFANFMCV